MYDVFQEYPAGVWSILGSTSRTNYTDTIFVCNANVNYRVELKDLTYNCTSVSSIDGGIFQNIIVPSIPVFDSLSVDDNNNAQMSWNVSSSPDTEAYVIYQYNGTAWVPVDTVWGINNVNYTYLLSNADQASEQYRLAALDSCGNISPLGAIKSTIHVTASADICTRSAILTWTNYGPIGTGLSGYNIYISNVSPTGPYTLAGSVSGTTFTYTESGLPPNTTYYFKIEAFDNSGLVTVSSNRLDFISIAPIHTSFFIFKKCFSICT